MIYDVKVSARNTENMRVVVERYYIIEVNDPGEVMRKLYPALARTVISTCSR